MRRIAVTSFGVLLALAMFAPAPLNSLAAEKPAVESPRDGSHDFDFELGSWKIHLKKLQNPLTGSTTWVEFDGTSHTRKLWDGRAMLEEFQTESPTRGHIEGVTLRLYNPTARQWSLNWTTSKEGSFGVPTIGEFKNGIGEFYDYEAINDRMVWVRLVWSQITPTSAHSEQAFSTDGGKTWEVNWITDQTRMTDAEAAALAAAHTTPSGGAGNAAPDRSHDFDFEIGSWHSHISRLAHPLTGSTEWVEYDGTSEISKVWDGRANLVELEVASPTGKIEGLSLRLYNPTAKQWSLNFSNSRVGTLSAPTVGSFHDGRGEFYDMEDFGGRMILVRNVFFDITKDSYHFEQSFSLDGGKTWEVNWKDLDTRMAK
jgi:BNR/Asp-box repeat